MKRRQAHAPKEYPNFSASTVFFRTRLRQLRIGDGSLPDSRHATGRDPSPDESVRLLHGFIRSILWSALFSVHRNGQARKENPYGKTYRQADIFETGHRVSTRHIGFSHRFHTRCRTLRAPRMRENRRRGSSCHKNKEGARCMRAPSLGFLRFRSGLPHSSRRMACAEAPYPAVSSGCRVSSRPADGRHTGEAGTPRNEVIRFPPAAYRRQRFRLRPRVPVSRYRHDRT